MKTIKEAWEHFKGKWPLKNKNVLGTLDVSI